MPVSHADLQIYANLIAADFERYFSALTRHLRCLEVAWQDGIERSRTVGAEHEAFAARAKGLVLRDKLGVESLALPERLE